MTRTGLALVLVGGCSFAPIDATNRMPPCADGYEEVGNRCVLGGRDAGNTDAGLAFDAGFDAFVPATDAEIPPLDADTDAADEPGLSECATGGALESTDFCDGFENPGFNWSRQVSFGSVVQTRAEDGITPYRGLFMLRARTTDLGAWAQALVCPMRPGGRCPASGESPLPEETVSSGDLYLRTYVYVPSTEDVVHVSVMHGGAHRGFDPLDNPVSFNLDGAGSLMYVGAENMRHPTAPDPTYAFPRDQWVCVRTHVVVDDTAGEVRSWVEHDDPVQVDLVTEAVGIDTLPDTPYLHFGLGVAWSSATQDALTLYFDEVGVSRTPIPCD
ncbi:MAG: hypothetical protein H6720_15035 [Sandaracinus sp.]|nr:hypothetical protein [Sandaracinus sp.]